MIAVAAAIALAAAFAAIRRGRPSPATPGEPVANPDDIGGAEDSDAVAVAARELTELLRCTLRRDLSLAAEHLHSIRWLLEIARQHQQPIPTAALTNLDLVSKHLGEMQRRIEAPRAETVAEPDLSASAHLRETQSPLHPRPPSFGCRASPSDISTPCD